MNDIKFACPSCGQHIQCDKANAGRNLTCPSCRAQIRIPRGGESQKPGPLPTARLVNAAPGKTQAIRVPDEARTARPAGRSEQTHGPDAPKKTAPGAGSPSPAESGATLARAGRAKAAGPAMPHTEGPAAGAGAPGGNGVDSRHFLCPVCNSELAPAPSPGPGGKLAEARLVRRGELPAGRAKPSDEPGAPRTRQNSQNKPPSAPRSAKKPSGRPGGEMKPRLDYILGGKPPVPSFYETSDESLPGARKRRRGAASSDDEGAES